MPDTSAVLVTGAGSGIGRELARRFAQDGHELVLLGRHRGRLEELAGTLRQEYGATCHALVCDLAASGAVRNAGRELERLGIIVDTLVSNAGVGTYGLLWESDIEEERRLIATNLTATVELTRLLVPGMVERRRGRILIVGSMAGFLASPYATTYYASKAFLMSFSEGLRSSLSGTGVSVTLTCPGPTSGTRFNRDIGASGPEVGRRARLPSLTARQVAEISYRAMLRKQAVVIPGLLNAVIMSFMVHLPRAAATEIIARGQRYVDRRKRGDEGGS